MFDISCESSARQMSHLKCQTLISYFLKKKKKKKKENISKCHLLQLWLALEGLKIYNHCQLYVINHIKKLRNVLCELVFSIQCLVLRVKIFSRRHFEIFFLIFPRKQVLTFHANCLHWRQFA